MSVGEALLLAIGGLVAGFLNTLAGGGSLLTMPLLVLCGMGWDAANATSRVSVLLQTVSAVHGFAKVDVFDWRDALAMGVPTMLGGIGGAALTHVVDPDHFEWVAVVLLSAVGLAMIIAPKIASGREPKTLGQRPLAWPLLLLTGVYGGFIQAGIGYLLLAIFGGVLGRDLKSGNALKSALVLLVTIVALPVLGLGGRIDWAAGLTLGAGSIVGAQLAVRFAVQASERTLRLILLATLAVVIAVAVFR